METVSIVKMEFSKPGCQFIPMLGTGMRLSRDELTPPRAMCIAASKLQGTETSSSGMTFLTGRKGPSLAFWCSVCGSRKRKDIICQTL